MKKLFQLLFLCFLSFLAASCGSKSSDAGNHISFNISGAKAIVTSDNSSSSSRGLNMKSENNNDSSSSSLVKLLDDGKIEEIISNLPSDDPFPTVSYITTGSDGSVYICFDTPGISALETHRYVQFYRIYPNNHHEVIWRYNMDDENGYIYTSKKNNPNYEPIIRDSSGNFYFMVRFTNVNGSFDAIYKYDPAIHCHHKDRHDFDCHDSHGHGYGHYKHCYNHPVLVTPENAPIRIEQFSVDDAKRIYIRGYNYVDGNAGEKWFRYYTPDAKTPVNICYSSTSNGSVNTFSVNKATSIAAILSYGMKGFGLDVDEYGILKADIASSGVNQLFSSKQMVSLSYSTVLLDGSENKGAVAKLNSVTSNHEWIDEVKNTSASLDESKFLDRASFWYYSSPSFKTGKFAEIQTYTDAQVSYNLGNAYYFLTDKMNGTLWCDYLATNGFMQGNGKAVDYIASLSVDKFIWGGDGALYGNFKSTASGERIIRLIDSTGARVLSLLPFSHIPDRVTLIKDKDGYFYHRYSVTVNGAESGYHKLARYNYLTGVEEELCSDPVLAAAKYEIIDYAVSSNNAVLYFCATDVVANTIVFGKIDLATKVYTPIVLKDAKKKFNFIFAL